MRGGATEINKSRTVDSSRTEPMNCRITPSPPVMATLPSSGARSPEIILSSVVFPDPFAPINATFAPSPTRKETSLRRTLPSDNEKPTPLTSMCPIICSLHFVWQL